MAESADKPPSGAVGLDEESDVIELTEEVNAGESPDTDDGDPVDELDMPEFKVPDDMEPTIVDEENDDYDEEEPTTQRLSQEALERARLDDLEREALSADGDDQQETAEVESETVDSSEDEAPMAEEYDRQAMVKTIQMDAFDREAIEGLHAEEVSGPHPLLFDARFAPQIIATPPTVIVKKWREGLPGSVERLVGVQEDEQEPEQVEPDQVEEAQEPVAESDDGVADDEHDSEIVEDQPETPADEDVEELDADEVIEVEAAGGETEEGTTPAEDVPPEVPEMGPVTRQIEVDEEVVEADPHTREEIEAVEIDEELLEEADDDEEVEEVEEEVVELDDVVVEEEGEAPPAQPPAEPPVEPKKTDDAEPAAADSQQGQQEAQQSVEKQDGTGDDEMKGLVEELLEEEREQKQQKQRQQRPVKPQDIWFEKVFSEEFLRTVPRNIDEITESDVDFIEASLRLKKKSRILDLACGYGRHSIELAERGYEMVGLDLSRPLLERALETAQERSLSIKFIRGDMRELSFSGMFDGCFVWDTSLGYFDDRTNLRVLKGIFRALKTGGRLLIDVVNRDHVIRQTPTRLWWEGEGCIFLEESEFDYQTSTLQAQRSYIYEDGTPPQEHTSYIRLYTVHELRQMLHVAGFKVLEVSGDRHYKGYFLGAASQRIIILAEKRKPKTKPKPKRKPSREKKPTQAGWG